MMNNTLESPSRFAQTAKKLRVLIVEEDSAKREPLYLAILRVLHDEGIAGATVFKGTMGFGERRVIHTTSVEALSYSVPIVIESTDAAEKIDRVAEKVAEMVSSGLVEVMPATLLKRTPATSAGEPPC